MSTPKRTRKCAALLYHHVGPLTEPACRGLNVSARAFATQIGMLSKLGFDSIVASEWTAYITGRTEVPRRPLMMTFDDAYADLTRYAFPVLQRYGFKATVFVPTGLLGERFGCNPRNQAAGMPLMSAADIREWSARGFEFGAHTQTHVDLSQLEKGAAENEIIGSRRDLEEIIERPVLSFAYPFGRVSNDAERVVEENFSCAFSICEGMNDVDTPPSRLRRTMVQHHDSPADVYLRARFGRSVICDTRTAISKVVRHLADN